MHCFRWCWALCLVPALVWSAYAQVPKLESDSQNQKPVPVVSFDFLFPATPTHYAMSIDSMGRAAYRSDALLSKTSPSAQSPQGGPSGTPYILKFVVSRTTTAEIFELTRRAHYFQGNFESKNRVADSGTKTLSYGEGPDIWRNNPTTGIRNSTTYNYSDNEAIQQLTDIFQAISNAVELGRRLDYLHRFDKLGLDAELRQAEQLAQEKRLLELQAIAPSLKAIADDSSVINAARKRAQQLLAVSSRK
jgi:hypothetical protein